MLEDIVEGCMGIDLEQSQLDAVEASSQIKSKQNKSNKNKSNSKKAVSTKSKDAKPKKSKREPKINQKYGFLLFITKLFVCYRYNI